MSGFYHFQRVGGGGNQRKNGLGHMQIIRNSNAGVPIESFIGTQPRPFVYKLWFFGNTAAELMSCDKILGPTKRKILTFWPSTQLR